MRIGSLCTGYGGIEMGLAVAGVSVDLRWCAETEGALDKLHTVPNLGDITVVDWSAVEPVDLLVGGIPCQPTSAAGRQLGDADPRWLWPATRVALAALNPRGFLLENVRGLVSYDKGRLFDGIVADLLALGYGVRWLTLGACAVGMAHHRHRVFLLAVRGMTSAVRLDVPECGQRGTILPTPTARDGRGGGGGGADYWQARSAVRTNGMPLDAVAGLLPTPRASDGVGSGPNQRGRKGDLAMPSAVQPGRWGQFATAVQRQADALGTLPPEPTEPNRNGNPRLRPAFVEWLMGLPAGHVTDHLDRNAALRALGNGVVPQQLAAAWRHLVD